MAIERPITYVGDQQGKALLIMTANRDALDRELLKASARPGTAHYDRLVFYRDAQQFGIDLATAFLPHIHGL